MDKTVLIAPIKPERENETYEIEKDLLKPVLKSSDIKRYFLYYKNYYIIFPYRFGKKIEQELEYFFISESEMEKSTQKH